MRLSSDGLSRVNGGLGIVWGTALLAGGPRIWLLLTGAQPDQVDQVAVRVLGIRHLGQGAVQLLVPRRFHRIMIAADVLHAASMTALAVRDRGRRTPAVVTTGVALLSAAVTATVRARR